MVKHDWEFLGNHPQSYGKPDPYHLGPVMEEIHQCKVCKKLVKAQSRFSYPQPEGCTGVQVEDDRTWFQKWISV